MKNSIYALLIGVGDYKEVNAENLYSYKMDVGLLRKALVNGLKCSEKNIEILLGQDADGKVPASDLAHGIVGFQKRLMEDDTFIFYFSGHGSPDSLVFSDGPVDLQSVVNYIGGLPCKNKLVIFDCCYAGNFQIDGAQHLSMEQSIEEFVGHGIAIYASSSADEVSRINVKGGYSVFTGALVEAMSSSAIVHKGKIDLKDIYKETQWLISMWNSKNPDKSQKPVYRSKIGGSVYFQVEEYHSYKQKNVSYETDKYDVMQIKPLNTGNEKRLSVFVVLKEMTEIEELVGITKELVKKVKYTNVHSDIKSKRRFGRTPAKAIWCYFGNDESDIVNSNHPYYTVWATQDVKGKYYRTGKNYTIIDDICVYENPSYQLVKQLQAQTMSREAYIKSYREFLKLFVNMAEDFFYDLQEMENQTLSCQALKDKYLQWMNEVKRQYIRLSDVSVGPDDFHNWSEEIVTLAGYVLDCSILLAEEKEQNGMSERNVWLIQHARQQYDESLERLREIEGKMGW